MPPYFIFGFRSFKPQKADPRTTRMSPPVSHRFFQAADLDDFSCLKSMNLLTRKAWTHEAIDKSLSRVDRPVRPFGWQGRWLSFWVSLRSSLLKREVSRHKKLVKFIQISQIPSLLGRQKWHGVGNSPLGFRMKPLSTRLHPAQFLPQKTEVLFGNLILYDSPD